MNEPRVLDAYRYAQRVSPGCQHRMGCKCESSVPPHNEELWKVIPGYEPWYEVSCLGRVRSITRLGEIRKNCVFGGKVLKPFPAGTMHYPYVSLWVKNKGKNIAVHRLVLLTFVGPRQPDQECRHLNGIVTDTRLGNLCWGTRFENEADKYRLGTGLRGTKANTVKLTDKIVLEIRNSAASARELADRFGVKPSTIRRARNGEHWGWLRASSPAEEAREWRRTSDKA